MISGDVFAESFTHHISSWKILSGKKQRLERGDRSCTDQIIENTAFKSKISVFAVLFFLFPDPPRNKVKRKIEGVSFMFVVKYWLGLKIRRDWNFYLFLFKEKKFSKGLLLKQKNLRKVFWFKRDFLRPEIHMKRWEEADFFFGKIWWKSRKCLDKFFPQKISSWKKKFGLTDFFKQWKSRYNIWTRMN